MRKAALWVGVPVVVAVGGLGTALVQERGARWRAEQRSQQLEAELKQQVEKANKVVPVPEEEEDPAAPAGKPAEGVKLPLPTEYIRTIEEARASLDAARKELSAVRNDLADAEQRIAAEKEQREKLAAELADTTETLATARRTVTALEADQRSKNDRLVKLEANEKLIREAAGKSEMNAARALRSSQELEDLSRRRETLLALIVRRYRDITDQYRTLTLRMQTRSSGNTTQQGFEPGSAGELSRIQSSVQQAEEDFRQLNALNAQASRILRGGR